MILKCTKCLIEKHFYEFHKSSNNKSGLCTWCKSCEYKRKKEWKDKNPNKLKKQLKRHREKHKKSILEKNLKRERTKPEEKKAQRLVFKALKNCDLIRPKQCTKCNKICSPEGHHFDYSKPLDVMWLCKSCHTLEHVRLRKIKTTNPYWV